MKEEVNMIKNKKRSGIGYSPTGTPGMGMGHYHRAATNGSGRLGRAMRAIVGNAGTPKKTMTRALARRAKGGGDIEAALQPSKPSAAPARKGISNTSKKVRPPAQVGTVVAGGQPASKRTATDSTQQQRAMTAAKDARIKEAGLGGKRAGKASASGKRAQGRRDSKH